jgi:toxin-antitoxin system PIN domain toxin
VILIDSNLLLYAYNSGSAHHEKAREWLEKVLRGPETIALPWAVVHAFLRISTDPRAFPRPYSPAEAIAFVALWFESSNVVVVDPGERYWQILRDLIVKAQARGPCVSDAHLAALALEHGATVYSSDRDFARFEGLRYVNPIAV